MIILGAKGFAKEVLEILYQQRIPAGEIVFFDDVSHDASEMLYEQFKIFTNIQTVVDQKEVIQEFILGIGGTVLRERFFDRFIVAGLKPRTLISPFAHIGHFNTVIGEGSTIMTGVVLTNDIQVGKGTLINLNATVGHDTHIGEFCDIMPGANISGGVSIGNYCSIGTGSVILPKIKIGHSVTVGAGAVVTKDVPDNTTVTGVPAKPLIR